MSKTVGNIKDVKYREAELASGEGTGIWQFVITMTYGDVLYAEATPENRYYRDVKEWYDAQTKKPFDIDWVELDS